MGNINSIKVTRTREINDKSTPVLALAGSTTNASSPVQDSLKSGATVMTSGVSIEKPIHTAFQSKVNDVTSKPSSIDTDKNVQSNTLREEESNNPSHLAKSVLTAAVDSQHRSKSNATDNKTNYHSSVGSNFAIAAEPSLDADDTTDRVHTTASEVVMNSTSTTPPKSGESKKKKKRKNRLGLSMGTEPIIVVHNNVT